MTRRVLAAAWVLGCLALLGAAGLFARGASQLAASQHQLLDVISPPTRLQVDTLTVVFNVQRLARLETARLELQRRVRGQRGTDDTWGWFGERLVFIAHGEVSAGVDLQGIGPEDVWRDREGRLHVRLPPPEIFHIGLDEEQSFVEMRERGWFAMPDRDFESEARRAGVKALEEAALERGLLVDAGRQAEAAVLDLLQTLGSEPVVFESASARSREATSPGGTASGR